MSDKKWKMFEKAEQEMKTFEELVKHSDKTRWGKTEEPLEKGKGKSKDDSCVEKADEYEREEKEGKKEKDPKGMAITDKGDTAKEKGKKLSSASSQIFKAEVIKFDSKGQWKIQKADSDPKPVDIAIGEGSSPKLPGNEDSADSARIKDITEKADLAPADKMKDQAKWNKQANHVADPKVRAATRKKIAAVERTKGK